MAVFKRGKFYWYEFVWHGHRIRESSGKTNKQAAKDAESQRKAKLKLGLEPIKRLEPQMFSIAAKKWMELNEHRWSVSNRNIYRYNLKFLLPEFGKKWLNDITADDVKLYQAKRLKEEASPRTINMEVGLLRSIMRKNKFWHNIQPDITMLAVNDDVGRALSKDEIDKLLAAAQESRSRSLYPAILLSIHTGMRNGELRLLRWKQVDFAEKTVTVGKSKTKDGSGRVIPLSEPAFKCLRKWAKQFPKAEPEHYVFPSETVGLDGEEGRAEGIVKYDTNPNKPMGSWKSAWNKARTDAKVECRWHDLRHCFVSKLAEGRASDQTIMSLAGHVSKKMLQRYSHIGMEAKRAAVWPSTGRLPRLFPAKIPHKKNIFRQASSLQPCL